MMKEDCGRINIPKRILEKIEKRLDKTEFKSVEEYVSFVLDEVVKENAHEETSEPISNEDDAKIKGRLKALGYID